MCVVGMSVCIGMYVYYACLSIATGEFVYIYNPYLQLQDRTYLIPWPWDNVIVTMIHNDFH